MRDLPQRMSAARFDGIVSAAGQTKRGETAHMIAQTIAYIDTQARPAWPALSRFRAHPRRLAITGQP
ncbi:hypothetical protein A6456_28965 [Paraburkholderia tropica]|nr:hypothetical protein A6456_28965 [Paraburkholderia tropica]